MKIVSFEPMALRVDRVGPFVEPFVLDFAKEGSREYCNFFLLGAGNGKGKTTLFESFALAMSLMGDKSSFSLLWDDIERRGGGVQLDVRLSVSVEGTVLTHILSLSAGSLFYSYTEEELASVFAERQDVVSCDSVIDDILFKGDLASDLYFLMQKEIEKKELPMTELEPTSLPTILYFSADRIIHRTNERQRGISRPANSFYSPVHVFSADEFGWENSIENMLCWLRWLSCDLPVEDSVYGEVRRNLNELVFPAQDGPADKKLSNISFYPPVQYISSNGELHKLNRLSSGERSRLQLFFNILSLRTENTVVLIDEMELHLHPKTQQQTFEALLKLLEDMSGLKVYVVTHSKELVIRGVHLTKSNETSFTAGYSLI